MNDWLRIGGWAGLLGLAMVLPITIFDMQLTHHPEYAGVYIVSVVFAVLLDIVFTVGLLVFVRGVSAILTGALWTSMALSIASGVLGVASIRTPSLNDNLAINGALFVIVGIVTMAMGFGFIHAPKISPRARSAGWLLIVAGASFATIVLTLVGLALSIAAQVMLALMLFDAARSRKSNQKARLPRGRLRRK